MEFEPQHIDLERQSLKQVFGGSDFICHIGVDYEDNFYTATAKLRVNSDFSLGWDVQQGCPPREPNDEARTIAAVQEALQDYLDAQL